MEAIKDDYSHKLTVLKEFMRPEDMESYFGLTQKTFNRWEQMGLKAIYITEKTKVYRADDIRNFLESLS